MNNSFLKNLFVWFIIFASLMGAYQIISEGKKQYSDLKYSEFLNVVESDQVLQVEIKGNEITGNGGDDTIDGSGGVDMAIYDEAYTNYTVSNAGGTVTVSHTGGSADEGNDTLTNIEFLKFSDGHAGIFSIIKLRRVYLKKLRQSTICNVS